HDSPPYALFTLSLHDALPIFGIPYYVVNQERRFEDEVVRPFVQEYLSGRTPIPCSLCNNHLKFDQLLVFAKQIGAEKLATGHYADRKSTRLNSSHGSISYAVF